MIDLDVEERNPRIRLHRKEDFVHMRKAGRLAAECLDVLVAAAQPGVTTAKLDDLCVELQIRAVHVNQPRGVPRHAQ
jgi:methionyl aminopeptidase